MKGNKDPCEEKTDPDKAIAPVHRNNRLKAEMVELARTREELKKAKDSAMQSWLDSKPLLDELEKVKAALASAQNRSSISAAAISELEAQLQTTNSTIQVKKQQELEATKRINMLSQAIERANGDTDALELQVKERKRLRSKLKQLLRVKRQTLRALSLRLHATAAEIDAAKAAAEDAQQHIKRSQKIEKTVQITRDEYQALKRRAKEETLLADWQVVVAGEQRATAESNRETALMRWRVREEVEAPPTEWGVDKAPVARERAKDANGGSVFRKARAQAMDATDRVVPVTEMRRVRSGKRSKVVKKKRKPSIFHQIKSFVVRSINRWFG